MQPSRVNAEGSTLKASVRILRRSKRKMKMKRPPHVVLHAIANMRGASRAPYLGGEAGGRGKTMRYLWCSD